MVEALAQPSDKVVHPDRVHHFMPHIIEACQKSKVLNNRSLKGSGRSLAFAAVGISGQALISEGRLIHLSAHQKCIGQSQPLADLVPAMESARSNWDDHRPPSLDTLGKAYIRRRRRYNAFKSKLQDFSPSDTCDSSKTSKTHNEIQTADTSKSAPAPRPLNPELHKFFLQLFSRH